MNQSRSRKLLRTLFAASALGVAGICFAQAAVEEVWVKQPSLPIREGKGAAFATVATAKKGDKLVVIAREEKWLKVQLGDKQGYVFENAISEKKIGGGAGFGDVLAGGSDTSGMSTAAAGKGLNPQAEQYAKSKRMDPKIVDEMIKRNKAITGAEWTAFAKEGNVGADHK